MSQNCKQTLKTLLFCSHFTAADSKENDSDRVADYCNMTGSSYFYRNVQTPLECEGLNWHFSFKQR